MSYIPIYFSERELSCRCGCNRNACTDELKMALDDLRKRVGRPITIHCAYRCEKHNAATTGAVSDSQHMFGKAADLVIEGLTLQEMYNAAKNIPAFFTGGIGVYDDDFIHVDVRGVKARWARKNGKYISIKESGLVEE